MIDLWQQRLKRATLQSAKFTVSGSNTGEAIEKI